MSLLLEAKANVDHADNVWKLVSRSVICFFCFASDFLLVLTVQNGDTALFRALSSVRHSEEVVELLITKGRVNLDHRNAVGHTALMEAALYCPQDLVARLVHDGRSNVNSSNVKGESVLLMACAADGPHRLEMVQFLIDHKADVHHQDKVSANMFVDVFLPFHLVLRLFSLGSWVTRHYLPQRTAVGWRSSLC